jgi:hypothetical protein
MIRQVDLLRRDLPWVTPVIVMDGIGSPADKARVYRQLLGGPRLAGLGRGIKLFPLNPYEEAAHVDTPVLPWSAVFDRPAERARDGPGCYLRPVPDVIVMT